ncbi:MAG: hypothetical protein M1540_01260 [Candidatus Bathyarchaeota archaeon]|nr:hypothetical protein [Candidatus Bathyarchaeota archaeon]
MQPKLTNLQAAHQSLGYHKLGGVGLVGVEVLVGLGLTGRQARVFLAVLRLGCGRAVDVMGVSLVHHQEIYPLINSLLSLGLIRKHLTKPLTYTAAPFAEVAQQLLQKKTRQLNSLTMQTQQLAERLQTCPRPPQTATPCFGTLFGSEQTKKHHQAIAEAQGSIEFVVSWVRFRQLCFHCEAELKAALKRGVRIRVAVEKPPRHNYPKWIGTLDGSAFELREMAAVPPVAFAIFDGAEVAVAYEPTTRLTLGPDLWSRHPGVVAVCCGYFDRLWAALK